MRTEGIIKIQTGDLERRLRDILKEFESTGPWSGDDSESRVMEGRTGLKNHQNQWDNIMSKQYATLDMETIDGSHEKGKQSSRPMSRLIILEVGGVKKTRVRFPS